MMSKTPKKCKNYSCPFCQSDFCEINVNDCSFKLLENREGTIIHPTAYVRPNTIIDKEVVIAEMACIGSRGMTLERDENKKIHWRRKGKDYPVILQEGSYVGARSIIMSGTKWNTKIGKNTFIGPNVSIGHDNGIGSHCLILSGTITCGSVFIGDYSYISPGVLIRSNIIIGKNVFIGLGSLVTKDVPDDAKVFGRPAKEGAINDESIMRFQKWKKL